MMTLEVWRSQDGYRDLCDTEITIPLFSQAWWLDAVAGESWNAVLVRKCGQTIGAHPFASRCRWGLTLVSQPKLTQSLGPWVRPTTKAYPKELAYEKAVLGALADGLPRYHHYAQNWHWSRQNWLAFYWRGFQQTTRYTYRLQGIGDERCLWEGLQQNIRGDIRKARDRYEIRVRRARGLDEFLALNRMTFERQRRQVPYSRDLVAAIDAAAAARGGRDCLIAEDRDGNLHAGVYIVRDGDTAYYLMGGGDPAFRGSGATSLVLWEAIRNQPASVETFDFEGSMREPIERFFRAFGATQVPYFRVSHSPSRLIRAANCIRTLIKT